MISNEAQISVLGLGNVLTIELMTDKVGRIFRLVSHPSCSYMSGKYILPCVGHFEVGTRLLSSNGFLDCLTDTRRSKKFDWHRSMPWNGAFL